MVSRKFDTLGIGTCAELQKLSLERLIREFGPKSGNFYHLIEGSIKTSHLFLVLVV